MKHTSQFISGLLLLAVISTQAQNKQDASSIKSMCGCYEVTFEFGETFASDKDYKFYDNYKSHGLEWVELVEDSEKKIVLQHLLIVEDSVGKKDIVKHWRQDWLYENKDFHMYDKDNTWRFVQLPASKVKGQWTQKVFQVDDGPRYQGTATWVHVDGRHFWENTTDSPLPRREFTKRNDYNVLQRRNRQEITTYGWLHEQDNNKIIRTDKQPDKVLVKEKGWDTYKKTDDGRCLLAQQWWASNTKFWEEVRNQWSIVYTHNKILRLEKTVENKPLFMHLFALKPDQTQEIKTIIEKFVKK